MGKKIHTVFAVVLMVACVFGVVACAKSRADQFLDEFEELVDEMVTAYNAGNLDKVLEIQHKAEQLEAKYSDLDKADFDESHEQRMLEIMAKYDTLTQ